MVARRAFLEVALQAGAGSLLLRGAPAADLAWLSLQEAGAMIHRKAVSPVQLVQACLARIERLNPVLNAFITVTADQALQQARDAEAEIGKGKWRGPLHGVPIALKDLFDTVDVRTTAASGVFKDRVPSQDAQVVRRLRVAGAVLLGKLNMHECAYGPTSVASYFGVVHNPWRLDSIAGGSSGGSAVAVAAGLCYGALGTDTGGSIRLPAAYCGIAGLKPTYGRVSTRGVIPLAWSLDHVGPMCRSVGDAALLLQPIAGYDPEDTNSVNVSVPDYSQALRTKVSALRLGTPRKPFYEQINPEIEAAVNQAIDVLRRLTASVRDVQLPAFEPGPVFDAEAYAYHAAYLAKTPELYQRETRERLETGAKVTAQAYIQRRRDLARLRSEVRGVFADVDVLITPTTPVPPPTIAESLPPPTAPGSRSLLLGRNTRPFSAYGLPTISVPCGFTKTELPIGLQISGPPLAEPLVLALAHAYEQATGWHTRRPSVEA
jgi:aspartyl-tRNA(Asn)/glutamyl-tRNA(Gln) amidotransferase subunit A